MNWWGKILGATVGLATGGPVGALLGGLVGHAVDSGGAGLRAGWVDVGRIQTSFFETLFSVMGHLAKADGRVSEREIAVADAVMRRMQLDQNQRRAAINHFNRGKKSGFPLSATIDEFHGICGQQPQLLRMFIEILIDAALADGVLQTPTRTVLLQICAGIGIPQWEFERLLSLRQNAYGRGGQRAGQPPKVADPYKVLGIDRNASERDIKQAYRRLISQNHPDKLVSRGLPKEMMDLAKEKTAEIRAAYEQIKQLKGFK